MSGASEAGEAAIAARNIRKRFGALAVLNGIDFSVAAGEAVGIVGPNGAGKTTLLSILMGALGPTDGTVFYKDGT